GSNVLISDEGFPGYVLLTSGLKQFEEHGGHRYTIGAGHDLMWLVREMRSTGVDGVKSPSQAAVELPGLIIIISLPLQN
ncbi:MAG TPA: hypothetical protein PKC25_00310, partial [Candidatus Rifleibacterium sp.]|nr:hypothetical protein [Candidatus Rifleibacterium sp.]